MKLRIFLLASLFVVIIALNGSGVSNNGIELVQQSTTTSTQPVSSSTVHETTSASTTTTRVERNIIPGFEFVQLFAAFAFIVIIGSKRKFN